MPTSEKSFLDLKRIVQGSMNFLRKCLITRWRLCRCDRLWFYFKMNKWERVLSTQFAHYVYIQYIPFLHKLPHDEQKDKHKYFEWEGVNETNMKELNIKFNNIYILLSFISILLYHFFSSLFLFVFLFHYYKIYSHSISMYYLRQCFISKFLIYQNMNANWW